MVGSGTDASTPVVTQANLSQPPPPLPPHVVAAAAAAAATAASPPVGVDFNLNGGAQWGWPPRPPLRGAIRPVQCMPPPLHPAHANRRRKGIATAFVKRGFHPPGPRSYGPPQQPIFYQGLDHFQQFPRKFRPQWGPRNVRPPPFPPNQHENFIPFHLPPPSPSPSQQSQSHNEEDGASEEGSPPKKKKRIANGTSRPWNREAAEKALAMELEFQKTAGAGIVVRFPDPELSKEIVQNFHPSIENVHFQAPCGGRYCFVTLKEEANVEKVMGEINKIKFGVGYLQTERKVQKTEENVEPESIDPFTLYVGNLPTNISTLEVKEKFPTATRIDIGYAKKMKYTRYAFVRYSTAEAALEAFKTSINSIIASRSMILRFRRHKGPVGPPGEKPAPSIIEAKPGEKLTVGAKLKAKKEKAKAEKALKEKDGSGKVKIKKDKTGDSSSDEEVEMENEATDSDDDKDEDDDEADDDDDDDDDVVQDEDDDDDEEDEEVEEVVDDDDDDLETNIPDDEDGWDDDDEDDAYKEFDFFGEIDNP